MLHSLKGIRGFSVQATDGDAGTVADIYFDERTWTTRFLVVDTGNWIAGHIVLISPVSIRAVDWLGLTMYLGLSRQQVKDSPGMDTAKPVSQQDEGRFPDWGYKLKSGIIEINRLEDTDRLVASERKKTDDNNADPYLRSGKEVIGYDIQAMDKSGGQVKDFLIDDEDWSVKLMVVDTHKWCPGKDVIVSTRRIAHVNYHHGSVVVNMRQEEIKNSAAYDALNLN